MSNVSIYAASLGLIGTKLTHGRDLDTGSVETLRSGEVLGLRHHEDGVSVGTRTVGRVWTSVSGDRLGSVVESVGGRGSGQSNVVDEEVSSLSSGLVGTCRMRRGQLEGRGWERQEVRREGSTIVSLTRFLSARNQENIAFD